jgi:trimethylamine-N-oxide reductase cytochrome c-type subunit TorC
VIGTIPPGAELDATGPPQGPRIAVRVSGWSLEGAPAQLFRAVGRRILQAELGSRGPSRPVVSDRETDPYGSVWQRVSATGWVARSDVGPDLDAVWKQAESLYQQRCGGCHALHPATEFTANQWPNVLKVMAHNAAFTPEQAALVTQYLQTHAKDGGAS